MADASVVEENQVNKEAQESFESLTGTQSVLF